MAEDLTAEERAVADVLARQVLAGATYDEAAAAGVGQSILVDARELVAVLNLPARDRKQFEAGRAAAVSDLRLSVALSEYEPAGNLSHNEILEQVGWRDAMAHAIQVAANGIEPWERTLPRTAAALRAFADRHHRPWEADVRRVDYGTGEERGLACVCGAEWGTDDIREGCAERLEILAEADRIEEASRG